jgi:hypothetical protein
LLWKYDEPKTSAGSTPGFEIEHGDLKAKIKFEETLSEPFTARMFHALGYHVDPTDHVRRIRIKYNRRILRELHLRQDVMMHFRFIGPPIASYTLQDYHDPLTFVQAAVLKDGSRLDSQELGERLYRDPSVDRPEMYGANFNPTFEKQIDHLELRAVNFQLKSDSVKSLGPWDYADLNHAELREVRAAGLLAAWLGWFDCRYDNTRLRVVAQQGDRSELRHYFSDVGAGLGRSDWGFNWSREDINEFPWEFTKPAIDRGPGRMRTPFRIVRFHTILENKAFRAMTEADARWMARRIARLSSEQVTAALIASGMDASETRLYHAKLMSRRQRLLEDIGLAEEFPLREALRVRPGELNYDPGTDAPPGVSVGAAWIEAPRTGNSVKGGILVKPNDPELLGHGASP